jgi:hypothetical protein
MKPKLYPERYYEARGNFETDIAIIKDQFQISYSIFYGQGTNSVALDISNDLPEHIKFKIIQSFNRHFRSFQGLSL